MSEIFTERLEIEADDGVLVFQYDCDEKGRWNKAELITPDGQVLELSKSDWRLVRRVVREGIRSSQDTKDTPNGGASWSHNDSHQLISMWENELSVKEIALELGRSVGAIKSRLRRQGIADSNKIEGRLTKSSRKGDHAHHQVEITTSVDDSRLQVVPPENCPRAFNNGSRWSIKEEKALLKDWNNGMALIPLLEKFGRGPGALFSRLCKLGAMTLDMNPYRTMKSED